LDSKLIVEQMSGRWKVKNENMRRLALAARDAFPPQQVTYKWVPREQNKAADALVNSALDGVPVRRGPKTKQPDDSAADVEPERAPNVLVGWSATHATVTTTLLLRHGETIHTLQKRFSGWGGDDPGLSDAGRAQARLAGVGLLTGDPIAAVVSSPMLRTRETADIVADQLGVEVVIEPDLRECAFGEWDGLTFAEAQERSPEHLSEWLASTSVRPPGGESFDEVTARVTLARDRIVEQYAGSTVLLVTHVTPVKTLVRLALDAPAHALFRMEVSSASLSTVLWFGDGQASVRTFNETAHLSSFKGPG
jgi:broad specificity phosphatase PhoE